MSSIEAAKDKPKGELVTVVDGENFFSQNFAALNHVVFRDLAKYQATPSFFKYKKKDIARFLKNPARYERQLREAVRYIYSASPHFRRIIQYFVGLTDLAYVVSPNRMDPHSANVRTVNKNYRRVLNAMVAMDVRTQLPNILTVCFREDVYYGTLWVTSDNITIQQLPSDYCKITSIEGNVPNVTFDFMYFDRVVNQDMLNFYPPEFRERYNAYKKNANLRFQELSSPNSFAVKCNKDVLEYAVPPLAGILREIFEIEDYKELALTRTALENYAMLVMNLGIDDDGNWQIPLEMAKEFYHNLDTVLPEEIGSILTPMPIDKISFERTNSSDKDTVAEAEQNLFTAAGVSSLLFNNSSASANALLLSIKTDQQLTFDVVKSIEAVINRYIQAQSYGKYFKVTFLDVSIFNRKEMGDAYLKAASYGFPTVSMYAATQGLGQSELDNMSFLETEVLGLQDMFKPLQSSNTMSTEEGDGATGEGGAPTKDIDELTDSGEVTREQQ